MTTYTQLAHFNDYYPPNFGWGARDPRNDSSLLVPFSHSGAKFGLMHRDVVPVFKALLDELVPHISDGLDDAADDGCYNPASVTVGGTRSFHTWAIAIDVNWRANPMYAPNRPTGGDALPPITSSIARKYGCEWGGDWSYPQDWMHIECHLSPDVARHVTSTNPTGKFLRRQWPSWMPPGHYFGLITGPAASHGGYFEREQPAIQAIQHRLTQLGYKVGDKDGIFGAKTKAAVSEWQHKVAPKSEFFGQVWSDDWRRLFTW